MGTLQTRDTATLVRITRTMNSHGAMTVETHDTNATRYVVDYADEDLRATLRQLPEGSSIPLTLESAGSRANVWKAIDIR
ncbi:hypothetical protein SAMN04487949_1508 [Halogranum gelatinilyticum]|uniref:DUF7999 domain-containing protein n=1 Tax=Halogranum gelatinilyticum TaxID=660521 RepID=A0A1G9SWN6_9EURY|nr:hypothetical protein [Halogranum gelatinilyticum]SDM39265.1 hypothetical protein SAMN04487949_1508 [Halogranum gelatinilyticum]